MLLESIDAIVERGHRAVVTLPEEGPLLALIKESGAEVRICPTPVLRRSYLSPRGLLTLTGDAIRSLGPGRRLIRDVRPDVLYLSTLTAPEWLVLARMARVPSVCHVHEAESTPSRPVRTALASPLLLADRLVVNSRFSEKVLTDVLPRLGRRSTVVYNGVIGPTEPVPPRPVIDGPARLLFVGRLSERKGVLDAVDIVRELERRGRPVSLDVAGSVYPGYEYVETELQRRVDELEDPERVRLHGYVDDVWKLLAEADILLVPSRGDEPFGNTAVEGTHTCNKKAASNENPTRAMTGTSRPPKGGAKEMKADTRRKIKKKRAKSRSDGTVNLSGQLGEPRQQPSRKLNQ